jgi:protein gp37
MPSKIEWCDETINPQGWGCWGPGGTPEAPKRCWYCYAENSFARRRLSDCPLCNQFVPHWHPERLALPYHWKKPRRIFWGSTSDIFHPCTPDWQIYQVYAIARDFHRHTHIFCTKYPQRYTEMRLKWPENCILLTTVTCQEDEWRIGELLQADSRVRGVSLEPLLGSMELSSWLYSPFRGSTYEDHILLRRVNWLIIGALTGQQAARHRPDPGAVQFLIDQARAAGVPLFLKDNLHWPEKIQEWPA